MPSLIGFSASFAFIINVYFGWHVTLYIAFFAIILGVITLLFATCGIHASIVGEEQKFLIAVWAFIPAVAFSIYPFKILSKWLKDRRKQ